jgi:hypothetical protein
MQLFPVRHVAVLIALLASAGSAVAQARTDVWERIEARRLEAKSETVVLPVGRRDGRYTAIRLAIPADPVFIRQITVVQASGDVREITVRRLLGNGALTDVLPLGPGIAELRLAVKVDGGLGPNPVVELVGEVAPGALERPRPTALPRGVPQGWVPVAVKRLTTVDGRDTLRVGREKGRFERLAVRVGEGMLGLRAVRIVQANGAFRDFPIDREVEAGARTPDLPVDPESPVLDVVLSVAGGSAQPATVELIGRYAADYVGAEGQVVASNAGWLLLAADAVDGPREEYVLDPNLGRMAKLRFIARHGGATVREVTLKYWNGRSEQVPVNRTLQRDEASPALELKRTAEMEDVPVRSIVVQRVTGRSGRSDTVIEVWGQY